MSAMRVLLKFLSLVYFIYQNSLSAYNFKSIEFLLPNYDSPITHTLFSPDSKKLVLASLDKKIRVFDVRSGSLLFTLESDTIPYTNVCFDEMGQFIAVLDKKIELWDLETGLLLQNHHHYKCPRELMSADGSRKLQIFNRNKVLIYSADTGEMEAKIESSDPIIHAYFWPDNKVIIISSEGIMSLYDDQGHFERLLTNKELPANQIASSQDQQKIAAVFSDWSVLLRHVTPFKLRTPENMKGLGEAGLTYIQWLGQFLSQAQAGHVINNQDLIAYIAKKSTQEEAIKIVFLGFKDLPPPCQNYVRLLFSLHDKPFRRKAGDRLIF